MPLQAYAPCRQVLFAEGSKSCSQTINSGMESKGLGVLSEACHKELNTCPS